MNWTEPVDIYCERADASFWAEPLNAVTNLSFLIAALVAWRMADDDRRKDGFVVALVATAAAIGVGSFLFHTFAQRWAGLADTLPILIFILIYTYAATARYFGARPLMAALAIVGFVAFSIGFTAGWAWLLPGVSASQGYLPVLFLLILYAILLARRGHPAAAGLTAAAATFSLSLTFRSLDMAVCASFPTGAHFLWHLLNGLLLGLAMVTFIRHGAPRLAPEKASR